MCGGHIEKRAEARWPWYAEAYSTIWWRLRGLKRTGELRFRWLVVILTKEISDLHYGYQQGR